MVPVTGMDNNWSSDIMPPRLREIKQNGKYLKTGKRRWPIVVSLVKMHLFNRLKLKIGENGEVPREYIHFPKGMPDAYFKQLTGEVCRLGEEGRTGRKMIWEKVYPDVEALDCAVYALALFKICGFHLRGEA
jgi:phage terminase large subunit GpA-like protein